jgi:hypothetical protein
MGLLYHAADRMSQGCEADRTATTLPLATPTILGPITKAQTTETSTRLRTATLDITTSMTEAPTASLMWIEQDAATPSIERGTMVLLVVMVVKEGARSSTQQI